MPPELKVGDWVSVTQCIAAGTYRVTLCRVGAVLHASTEYPLVIAGPIVKSIPEMLAEICGRHEFGCDVRIRLPPTPESYYLTRADGQWIVCTVDLSPLPGYLHATPFKDLTHA